MLLVPVIVELIVRILINQPHLIVTTKFVSTPYYVAKEMLMALRFEPSRFFLKGKVRQKKQGAYINTLKEKKLVRCETNTKEDRKSRVRYWSWDCTEGPEFWLEEEIMRLLKSYESERRCIIC